MIKVAIVGYGNIGKYAVDALRAAPDMELAGIVRRPGSEAVHGIKTVSDVEELGHVDAALLCTPPAAWKKRPCLCSPAASTQ
nr:Gfo/Idh/MocA family oxidoreductase [Akkermansia muciniphila]